MRGYDPVAREIAAPLMPDVEICTDVYDMADGCDALVVVTEWNEFKQLDLEKVKGLLKSPVIYDGRNIYDPALMREHGIFLSGDRAWVEGEREIVFSLFVYSSDS